MSASAVVIVAAETDFRRTDLGQFKYFSVAFFFKKKKTKQQRK